MNNATDGGGIWNDAVLNMVNCTVSMNNAINGGGIYHSDDLGMAEARLTHVTIADNEAETGGQIFNAEQLRQAADESSIQPEGQHRVGGVGAMRYLQRRRRVVGL